MAKTELIVDDAVEIAAGSRSQRRSNSCAPGPIRVAQRPGANRSDVIGYSFGIVVEEARQISTLLGVAKLR
jgi:hypothetical protein